MEYLNLYRSVKNPINSDTIDSIIDAYTDDASLYEGLVKTDLSKKETRRYNVNDRNRFITYLFNEWKNSIHRIVEKGYAKGEWVEVFKSLDKYLSTKKPTTADEVNEILYPRNINDANITKGLENLSWTSLGEFSSWEHIDSSYIYYGQHKRQPVEHRLYINCDSTVIDKIAYELATRCKKERLRYYFKYDMNASRADTIVVYCNTTNLPKFRRILNEIVRENKLQRNIHKPPLLTGVIDGWLGYGTEPEDIKGQRQSFNTKREKHLKSCIRKTTGLWIKNNLDFQIKLNGQQISYKDYFIAHIAYTIKEGMLRRLKDKPTDLEIYGYTRADITSKEFDTNLKTLIGKNINAIIMSLTDENVRINPSIRLHGQKVSIPSGYIEGSIIKQIKTIKMISTTYKPNLLKIIKMTSKEWGIDPENYAFDTKGLELFAIEDGINKMMNGKEKESTAASAKK